jgi:hypothetical protein
VKPSNPQAPCWMPLNVLQVASQVTPRHEHPSFTPEMVVNVLEHRHEVCLESNDSLEDLEQDTCIMQLVEIFEKLFNIE